MNHEWWKNAVIYQIYPRSFQDTNADGIGDLFGIIKRLDYLKELGIDAIWLSPVCQSPQDDNGYDISDYQNIDPLFGTLADMDELIAEAKKRNIKIIMDLVLSHSSDEHFWFKEALKGKDNPYHDYYIWQDGEEGTLPNDIESAFGGPTWTWVPELSQYYFHMFSVKQPDLNWQNPKLRQELYQMINWWIDRGVEGFRLDVVNMFGKDPINMVTFEGEDLHPFIRELSEATFGKAGLVSVGESWSATLENAPLYCGPDRNELSMVFQFEHICLDEQEGKEKWDLAPLPFLKLKEVLSAWQTKLHGKGWNSLFFENHDLPRIVSRWGNDKECREVCAKMFATILHGMEGTPYIYQGEELGMTNIRLPIEEYKDIETLNCYRIRTEKGYKKEEIMESIYHKSRDNARTPMQWDDGPQAGFTTGTPWMPVNPNYKEINAASQIQDENSIFSYYKKLIRLRKELPVIRDGVYELILPEDESIFAYSRQNETQQLFVICNFYGENISFPYGEVIPEDANLILCNYEQAEDSSSLRPYEARMYLADVAKH